MKFNSKFKFVELHSHLDGSMKPETIAKICKCKSIEVPFGDIESLKNYLQISEPSNLRLFLSKFEKILPLLKGDQEAIAIVCDDYVKTAAESEICYIETRFCPELLADIDFPVDSVIETVVNAFSKAEKEYGVVVRSILSALRQDDLFLTPNILDLAIKYQHLGVVGIDLAGDEQHSLENDGTHDEFKKIFQRAKESGIHRTVHAGENGSTGLIKEAINELHAERIGHGYQILEDRDYYHELRARNIHFEVCPTSSFLTGSVSNDPKLHPIHTFSQHKVNYSINCDDVMITGRNLKEEYQFCKDSLNISDDEIIRTNFNAAKASFLNECDKTDLLNHLNNVFIGFNH